MQLRYIILLTLILTECSSMFGQDPLDDFWKDVERRKGMKKKEMKDISAKYESGILASNGMDILILKQDYVYEKKNKRYIRGRGDYYARVYGIGVATDEGIVTSKHMYQPWKQDDSIMTAKGYLPVLTSVEFNAFVDSSAIIKEEGKYEVRFGNDLVHYRFDGMERKQSPIAMPDSTGFLMVFYYDAQKDSLLTRIIEFMPLWKEGTAVIDTQLIRTGLIGGLYFNVDTTQGKSGFIISAIISGDEKNQFRLVGLREHLPLKSYDMIKKDDAPKRTSSKGQNSNPSNKRSKDCGLREREAEDVMWYIDLRWG